MQTFFQKDADVFKKDADVFCPHPIGLQKQSPWKKPTTPI